MKFYVKNKEYNMDYEDMIKRYIKSGWASDVYKFDKEVYKINKEICLKYRLDEDSVNYLSKIPTKRILLPKESIYDENYEFNGYTMKYIKSNKKDDIKNITISKLLKELKTIKNDLLLLKDNNVFIDDLCEDNFIYNNGIYLIDPGSFEINKERSKEYIEIINREIMHDFIIKYVLFRSYKLNIKQIRKLYELFPLNEYLSDILNKESNKKQLINEYTDRIINNL